MKFRRRRDEELGINLTPLIDVVFLLLIFFMVSTSFTRATQLAVNLPEAEGVSAGGAGESMELVIQANGRVKLNGTLVSSDRAALREAMEVELANTGQRALTIAADGDAPHRLVVSALDAANILGVEQVTIATQEPEQ